MVQSRGMSFGMSAFHESDFDSNRLMPTIGSIQKHIGQMGLEQQTWKQNKPASGTLTVLTSALYRRSSGLTKFLSYTVLAGQIAVYTTRRWNLTSNRHLRNENGSSSHFTGRKIVDCLLEVIQLVLRSVQLHFALCCKDH